MKNKILKDLVIGLSASIVGFGLSEMLKDSFKSAEAQKRECMVCFSESLEDIERYSISKEPLAYLSKKLYSDTLKINLDDKMHYVTKKDEKSGVEDIRKINNGYEEAWLYLPEKQIWYETGIYSDSNSTHPFILRIGDALKENQDIKELIFYHNHPGEGYNKPSTNDLQYLLMQNFYYSGYKITGKIVADRGIVEYSLNSKGREVLEKAKKSNFPCVNDIIDIKKYFNIDLAEYKK